MKDDKNEKIVDIIDSLINNNKVLQQYIKEACDKIKKDEENEKCQI